MGSTAHSELWRVHCLGDEARREGWRSGLLMESDEFSVMYLLRPDRANAVFLSFHFPSRHQFAQTWLPVTDDLYRALDIGDDVSERVVEGPPTRFLVYARLALPPGSIINLDGPVSLLTVESFITDHEAKCRVSGDSDAAVTTFAVPALMGKKPEGLQ